MEDTLKGIKAYYEDVLADELTAIGTERGVTVPPWRELQTSRTHAQAHPVIEILPGAIDYDYRDSDGPLPIPVEYHAVAVRVFQVATTAAAAMMDVMRYAEGIRRVTQDDDTYGARFHDARTLKAEFEESVSPEDDAAPYRASVTVGVRVEVLPR